MAKDMVLHLKKFDLSEQAVMAVSLREARRGMIPFRVAEGFAPLTAPLLTAPDGNLKLEHSGSDSVATWGLTLSPAETSGWNVCRYSTAGCRAACLATSGKGAFAPQQAGRRWKTKWLAADPASFLRVLVAEIDAIPVEKWTAAGWLVAIRLNVLADLPWEQIAPWILKRIQARGIFAYDYTKWPSARRDRAVALSVGYDLSTSVSEKTTEREIRTARRPVVVFDVKRGAPLPATYMGRQVVNGDASDARFLDAEDVIVGLRYKTVTTTNRAAAVASGFVKVVN